MLEPIYLVGDSKMVMPTCRHQGVYGSCELCKKEDLYHRYLSPSELSERTAIVNCTSNATPIHEVPGTFVVVDDEVIAAQRSEKKYNRPRWLGPVLTLWYVFEVWHNRGSLITTISMMIVGAVFFWLQWLLFPQVMRLIDWFPNNIQLRSENRYLIEENKKLARLATKKGPYR